VQYRERTVTSVTPRCMRITEKPQLPANNSPGRVHFVVLRLDYLSCVLTVVSTVLIGRRNWEGWVLAGVNSAIICVIGLRTSQLGFIPANLFCIVLYGFNLHSWKKSNTH